MISTASTVFSDFTTYYAYGGIGEHDAVRIIFTGGGKRICLIMYKKGTGKILVFCDADMPLN